MAAAKLTAKKFETAKAGRHGDGAGLWLVVSQTGAKRWVYRFTLAGKVSECGLGSFPTVSLAEARERASEARKLHKAGVSPVAFKRANKGVVGSKPNFGDVADALIASKASEWLSDKHRAQWVMTLQKYCASIRAKPVDKIQTADVLEILTPVWKRTPETASRLRGRIDAVLDAAKAKGYREGENPAAWRGHLSHLLPKRQKLTRGHLPSLPYGQVPEYIARLRESGWHAALALEFCILTATRTSETLKAQWTEFDMQAGIWAIPARRMKAKKPHRVPLSTRAVEIIQMLSKVRINEYVFPGQALGKPLSEMAMEMVMRRLNRDERTWIDPSQNQPAVPHGFRSSFRNWAGAETAFQREIIEQALAHVVGGVEGAYWRDDSFNKRQALMEAWSEYCEVKSST